MPTASSGKIHTQKKNSSSIKQIKISKKPASRPSIPYQFHTHSTSPSKSKVPALKINSSAPTTLLVHTLDWHERSQGVGHHYPLTRCLKRGRSTTWSNITRVACTWERSFSLATIIPAFTHTHLEWILNLPFSWYTSQYETYNYELECERLSERKRECVWASEIMNEWVYVSVSVANRSHETYKIVQYRCQTKWKPNIALTLS